MRSLPLYLIGVISCFVLNACENATSNDSESLLTSAFDKGRVYLIADVDKVISERPITLTTSCLPLVTGKGRIAFRGTSMMIDGQWVLEAPLRDTFVTKPRVDTSNIYIPVEYTANRESSQTWQVRLQAGQSYAFDATALLDSVYVADSMRMYHVESDVAKRYSSKGYGYNPFGQLGNHLILRP